MTGKDNINSYRQLVDGIGVLLKEGRTKAAYAINTAMVNTYWKIGQHIVEYEQQGKGRAIYGSDLINRLSRDLTQRYGSGFGKSNLLYIRKLYICFPKSGTLSHLLSWSHYYEILKCDNPMEMNFYIKQCENERWSVRDVKGDNAPIGIILGAKKDKLTMQYALNGISNQIFTAQYQLYMPKREELQAKLYMLGKE